MTSSPGTPYRRYTASEIAVANGTDLSDLLVRLGYHVKPVGRYFTTVEMDSLRIFDRKSWYRFSESVGGDAIAFLRHFHGMTFQEAVGFLLDFNGYYSGDPPALRSRQRPRPPPTPERPPFVLPPPHINNDRICAYLRGRGIAPGVIDGFIVKGLLYEDRKYGDCIFVGRDRAGKPVFAAKRGTWDSFKGDVAGSDKMTAFRLNCDPALDSVYVFESPIDMMSWITLRGWCNAVALCGLYEGPLDIYLNENPHIRRIVLCLDADRRGREAAGRIGTKYRGNGFEVEDQVPPCGKDWNEYLRTVHPGDVNQA